MSVFVYEADAQDFGTLGLCGPLTPSVCDFLEQRNGLSVLTLDHPIDDEGRWATLVPGRIISAEVPVRNVTVINEDGSLVTTVEKWLIRTTATAAQRRLMSKNSGGKNKKTLPIWANKAKTERYSVTVTRKLTRYRIKCKGGTGWINPAALEY